MKSIKLSEIVTIVKPKYVFLKLKPNNAIRNNSTHKIARTISSLYKNVLQCIKWEEQKLINILGKSFYIPTKLSFHPNSKVSYYVYMEKKKVEFYFIIPKHYLSLLKEKMSDSWSNVTIQEVSEIPKFEDTSTKYQLYYRKEDGLSLKVDRRDNDLLTSNLNVVEVLEEGDKIGILYNFIPSSQHGWRHNHRHTIDKVKNHKPVDRNKYGVAYVLKYTLSMIDGLVTNLSEALSGKKNVTQDDNSILVTLLERLNGSGGKRVNESSVKKGNAPVVPTQVVVFSQSENKMRERNAAISLAQSFDSLHDDNELIYKPIKKNFALTDYSVGSERSKFSDDEAQNFIALAGRDLLEKFNFIEKVETLESEVPSDLQNGIISLGINRYRGTDTEAFLSEDPNYRNLLALVVGASRSGKSTYLENLCVDSIITGRESVVIFDFVENCEVSDNVSRLLPKDKVLEIRCDDLNNLQGMGYNEVGYSEDTFVQYNNAKRQTTNLLSLVDAINNDEGKLSPKMARYLESASLIVFINNGSIRDVFSVLVSPEERNKYLRLVPKKQNDNLGEYMESLRELDEIDLKTGMISNRTNLIIGIIDRLNILKRNPFMELMLKKDTKDNINLVDEMQKNQLITIRMPESMFSTQNEKDIFSIYMLSKLFLAAQIRADLIRDKSKRTRCSIVFDELYQTFCTERFLTSKLSQLAKFSIRPVVSCHYLGQIKQMKEEMKNGANASYILISGCGKEAYRELKDELLPYTEEDILSLPRYHALCLIRAKNQYAKFITKLPGRVQDRVKELKTSENKINESTN